MFVLLFMYLYHIKFYILPLQIHRIVALKKPI
jgi:hypothetical protein